MGFWTNGDFIIYLFQVTTDDCTIVVNDRNGTDASLTFIDENETYGFWGTLIGY